MTGMRGWTGLQCREGCDFLQWLEKDQALRAGFSGLAGALHSLLEDWVRTEEDVHEVWAAVPAVIGQCNKAATYGMPGAARAYAWIHLLDRYVRTWLALQRLVEYSILPMGSEGVGVLDVGTGPGPSAFAVHDFFAAMVRYSEGPGSQSWRQPARINCVESAARMNRFRHHLAERLYANGAQKSVLDMCRHTLDFRSIDPARERAELNARLREAYDDFYDEDRGEWESEQCHTADEANAMANVLHRYRLLTFSNVLTEMSTVKRFWQNLVDILSDAHPSSVLLLVGGRGRHYPKIYGDVAGLAQDAGFSREAECPQVSCSDAGMDRLVHAEQVWFYRRLRNFVGDLSVADPIAKDLKIEFEGEKPATFGKSDVRAYRKLTWRTDPG